MNLLRLRQPSQVMDALAQAGWRLDSARLIVSPTSNGTRIWRWKTTIRHRIPRLVILYQDEHIMVVNKPEERLVVRPGETGGA